MKKNSLLTFLMTLAYLAIAYPMINGFMKKDDKPNLAGIVLNNENPKFSSEDWFSGYYQSLKEDYNNDHWSFKEMFVRLNNQFYYNLFNHIRVSHFISCKENYVFADAAIFSYYGNDFIGEEKIGQLLYKCKVLQDTLEKKGISLIMAYAPGKGIGASKYIADKYHQPINKTNLKSFVAESKKLHLNYIDLVEYFYKIKDTCKYPLYAKYAHHWTNYFDCLASKEIIRYIENLRKTDLPDVIWNQLEISDTARGRDHDVLKSMNLYTNPIQNQQLAYPKFGIENDSLKNNTKILTIGDSYWYGIVYMNVPEYCFNHGQFWYYNNRVVPNPSPTEKFEAWQLDLKESIESSKVILIIGSDPALPKFGWGFIEDAYELYTNPTAYAIRTEKNRTVKQFEKQIREKPVLLKKATKLSQELQIPLDSAIKIDARKLGGIQ